MADISIVYFMGGACGDIVTAVIDPTNTTVDIDGRVILSKERIKLKDPNNFFDDKEKDRMLSDIDYKSISSHDYQYHLINQHTILYVGIFDMDSAIWAAGRFKRLHPGTWNRFGNQTIEKYAAQYLKNSDMLSKNRRIKILDIKDVVSGKLVGKLKNLGFEISDIAEVLYNTWLKVNILGDN